MQNKENYIELLSGHISRTAIDLIIDSSGDDPETVKFLAGLVTKGEEPLPMRAAWALDGIDLVYPELITPYLVTFIRSVDKFKHTGTLRNILKILSRRNIPAKFQGKLIHLCFDWLYDKKIPVAVKVHAMQIIANLSEEYPELKQELGELLRNLFDLSSPGFRSRASKILKSIN